MEGGALRTQEHWLGGRGGDPQSHSPQVPDHALGAGAEPQDRATPIWPSNPALLFPISLIFGALTVVTGIIGVVLGAEASRRYKKVNPRAEPLLCAGSLLVAAPCLYLALILAPTTFLASYVSECPLVVWVGAACSRGPTPGQVLRTLCLSLRPGTACYPHFTDA